MVAGIKLAVSRVALAMKPYSQDLRRRVVQALDRQVGTQSEVAELFGVSRTFVKKLLRLRRETGGLNPKPHGGGRVRAITGEALELLRQRATERAGITLEELRRHLAESSNVRVSTATVCRALQELGLARARSRRVRAPRPARGHSTRPRAVTTHFDDRRDGARPTTRPD